jgi:ribose transport system permease protein
VNELKQQRYAMKKILTFLSHLIEPQYILIWVLLVLMLCFSILSPAFRTASNLLEVLRSACINAVLVLGLTWIVAMGEIDVTFPDIAAFGSMVTAILVMNHVMWIVAILIALVVSALWGLLSGVLINVFKVNALIATIGVTTIAKASAYIIGNGKPIYLPSVDPSVEFVVFGKIAGIPILFIIVLVIYLVAAFLQNQTKLGQYLYAIGENRQAALEAGIPEKPIIYSFFILSALLAAAGGVLLIASFTAGQPNFQGSFFVDGLTAVFLGALVIKAGKPNVIGTLIGAIFIMVLGNGLTLLNVPFYIGTIIKGVLMVFGVAVITISKLRVQRRRKELELATAQTQTE